MLRRAITSSAVERFIRGGVPSGKSHITLRDGQVVGLGLRLLPSGSASWQFVYRLRGGGRLQSQRTITLGSWPTVTVANARAAAQRLAGKVAAGLDPRANIREAARRKLGTVAEALDAYEKWIVEDRKLVKATSTMSALRRGMRPFLKQQLGELDRRTLVSRIEAIGRGEIAHADGKGGIGASRDFRKHLHTFLERCVSLGLVSANVMSGHRMAATTKAERVRQEHSRRLLTELELQSIWAAAVSLGGPFGGLVQMALATGLRRGELAAMEWRWINQKDRLITIPAQNMKAGSSHVVPITSSVMEILRAQPKTAGDLVFPSVRRLGGNTKMSGWSQLLEKLAAVSGVSWVGLHDLRRFYRSQLAELGVVENIAEVMIAHKRPELIDKYNRSQMLQLRKEAAEVYDAWLRSVIGKAAKVEIVKAT